MLVHANRYISPILMLVYTDRRISPFEGGWGDVKFTNPHLSPSYWPSHLPLWRKSASWRSGVCEGGML